MFKPDQFSLDLLNYSLRQNQFDPLMSLYEQSKRQKVVYKEEEVNRGSNTEDEDQINVTDEVSTRASTPCSPVSCAESSETNTSLSSPNASNLNTSL